MAFIGKIKKGRNYTPGWFLIDNENCTRITKVFKGTDSTNLEIVTDENGNKYVPMGSIYKDVGIVYEDVDLTKDEAAGSVVTAGRIYKDRLTETAQSGEGLESLTAITVVDAAPKITRPTEFDVSE